MLGFQNREDGPFDGLIFGLLLSVHVLAFIGLIWFWSWAGLIALLCLHSFLAIFGISLGHHRLFAHKTFTAAPWLERVLAVCATLCFQGGPIFWSAVHRAHHRNSEKKGDPHSAMRGFVWSHCGWLVFKQPNGFSILHSKRLVTDLLSKPYLIWLDKWNLYLNVGSLLLIFVVCFAFQYVELFFWLGPIRMVTIWHVAWSTNSFLHGARFFKKNTDGIRNHILGDVLIGGEGWHLNHHIFPSLVTHHARWHFDVGFLILKFMGKMGWIHIAKPSLVLGDHTVEDPDKKHSSTNHIA